MTYTKKILLSAGLFALLASAASAAVPNMPGPYVGTYNVTDSSARISFLDNSTDEDGFKVYVYKDGALDTSLASNPIIVPAHDAADPYQYVTINDLDAGSLYQVKVSAFNSDGESAKTTPSSEMNGRFRTSPRVCKPEMPGEYVGTYNVTENSARISFLDNSDNEDGFKVYVYEYAGNKLVKTITVPAVNGTGDYQYANITGLKPNTIYQVRVAATSSDCGDSDLTHPSSATNGRFRTSNDNCPAMPGGYVGTYNVTSNSARISFLDNSDNETGFTVKVYKYGNNTPVQTFTLPPSCGVGAYQYADIDGLDSNTIYQVKVSAYNCDCTSKETTPSSTNNGRFRTK